LTPLLQIGLISFADQVDFATGHPCYSNDLALMTPANKKQLEVFAAYAKPTAGAQANFSNALSEAYRLLRKQPGETRG